MVARVVTVAFDGVDARRVDAEMQVQERVAALHPLHPRFQLSRELGLNIFSEHLASILWSTTFRTNLPLTEILLAYHLVQ